MAVKPILGGLAAVMVVLTCPAAGGAQAPATHDELGRALDELAGQLHGLGERFRSYVAPSERPLISMMLEHRQDLGLTATQVQALERIRADFQREAIKLDADQRVAEMDVASLLRADPVDLPKVEAKVREAERLRADMRVGRIRAIEQGKAQLTPEQRAKLQTLLAEPWAPRLRATPFSPPPRPLQ